MNAIDNRLGFEEADEKRISKPQAGHFKKHNSPLYRYLKEFRLKLYKDIEEGEVFDVSMFTENEVLKVTGTSKGKGYAGVMKRHNFSGSPATHGHRHDHRAPGSIGCAFPEHVLKGKKMAGRMGSDRVSVKDVKVILIDKEKGQIAVKGAVPGSNGSTVQLIA